MSYFFSNTAQKSEEKEKCTTRRNLSVNSCSHWKLHDEASLYWTHLVSFKRQQNRLNPRTDPFIKCVWLAAGWFQKLSLSGARLPACSTLFEHVSALIPHLQTSAGSLTRKEGAEDGKDVVPASHVSSHTSEFTTCLRFRWLSRLCCLSSTLLWLWPRSAGSKSYYVSSYQRRTRINSWCMNANHKFAINHSLQVMVIRGEKK